MLFSLILKPIILVFSLFFSNVPSFFLGFNSNVAFALSCNKLFLSFSPFSSYNDFCHGFRNSSPNYYPSNYFRSETSFFRKKFRTEKLNTCNNFLVAPATYQKAFHHTPTWGLSNDFSSFTFSCFAASPPLSFLAPQRSSARDNAMNSMKTALQILKEERSKLKLLLFSNLFECYSSSQEPSNSGQSDMAYNNDKKARESAISQKLNFFFLLLHSPPLNKLKLLFYNFKSLNKLLNEEENGRKLEEMIANALLLNKCYLFSKGKTSFAKVDEGAKQGNACNFNYSSFFFFCVEKLMTKIRRNFISKADQSVKEAIKKKHYAFIRQNEENTREAFDVQAKHAEETRLEKPFCWKFAFQQWRSGWENKNLRYHRKSINCTYSLVIINVFLFLLNHISHDMLTNVGSRNDELIWNSGEIWRLFTACFLHANVLHLYLNMQSLLTVGPHVEREYGNARFLFIYMISGIMGNLVSSVWMFLPTALSKFARGIRGLAAKLFNKREKISNNAFKYQNRTTHYLFERENNRIAASHQRSFRKAEDYRFLAKRNVISVGASGALMGLVGSLVVHVFRHELLLGKEGYKLLKRIFHNTLSMFLFSLIPHSSVDNLSHFGGFLGGAITSFFLSDSVTTKCNYYYSPYLPYDLWSPMPYSSLIHFLFKFIHYIPQCVLCAEGRILQKYKQYKRKIQFFCEKHIKQSTIYQFFSNGKNKNLQKNASFLASWKSFFKFVKIAKDCTALSTTK